MTTTASRTDDSKHYQSVTVWDLPTRVFHWSLLLCLIGSWITAEAGFDWTELHFLLGYTSLALIGFRVLWGIFGSRHARFVSFIRGPRETLRSLAALASRQPSVSVGHSPIGGWSALLMLAMVLIQATSGLFISDDIFYAGPYNGVVSSDTAGWLASVHHLNFNLLQAMVVLHVGAIAWYQFGKGTNLTRPMLSGRKQLPVELAGQGIQHSGIVLALMLLGLCALAVTALVQFAPPPPVPDYFY